MGKEEKERKEKREGMSGKSPSLSLSYISFPPVSLSSLLSSLSSSLVPKVSQEGSKEAPKIPRHQKWNTMENKKSILLFSFAMRELVGIYSLCVGMTFK